MGKVLSVVRRPLRDFNLESRAHRVISREKPVPAPKHKADLADYERMIKEHPEVLEESLKKHGVLEKNLKEVYVRSHDPSKQAAVAENPDRPLPLNRTAVEDYEFGFKEPSRLPLGRTTLRKVLRFISEHQADPKTYNPVKIAEEYLLPEEKVRNVLKYFRVYEVYIPDKKVNASFAGPSVPRTSITTLKPKQIGPGKDET